jgi:tetratricopeptide (TPR) repeat protein
MTKESDKNLNRALLMFLVILLPGLVLAQNQTIPILPTNDMTGVVVPVGNQTAESVQPVNGTVVSEGAQTVENIQPTNGTAVALVNQTVENPQPMKASLADAEGYYFDGKQAFGVGNWSQAIAQFKKAEAILDSAQPSAMTVMVEPETVVVQPKPTVVVKPVRHVADKLKRKQEQKDKLRFDIDESRRRMKKEPHNADLCYNLGVLYLQNEDYQEAARMFKRVTILNPKDYEAYFNLGVVYDKYISNNDLAEKYYKKYLKFAPPSENTEDVKIWLENLALQGKPEE